MTPTEKRIYDIVEPVITDLGFDLVQVKQIGDTLQIMAEDPKTRRLGIDDCTKMTREISAILDVEDPIKGAYKLEVSSPGIDRPLVKLDDYKQFKGLEAKLEVFPPIEGQKKFRGRIMGIENDADVIVDTDQGEYAIPFQTISKSKLVLTDELIKRTKA
jgi:ribosome maturation factor RimP